MKISYLDLSIIIIFMAFLLWLSWRYRKQAGKDLSGFFLGGRDLPWYIAGISMVATTFAADTPLAVTEFVTDNGIAGNWIWWNALAGGTLTTFLFAHLWRRAGVLTEVELLELRYSGRAGRFLRGFKALYLGVLLNLIIIAWVNLAFQSLLMGFFGLSEAAALIYTGLAMLLAAGYSAISGLKGVAVTDAVQFVVAMLGCIILAILVLQAPEIGGMTGLKERLATERPGSLQFLPLIGSENAAGLFGLSLMSFFAYIGVQWWASWYPGAEPGGGGYVAQRMMSTRTDRDAMQATLLFQIAHYCLRPWPWIIVALAATLLYPNLSDSRMGFVLAMRDYLPDGLRGLLLVAFLAAYMSTISTQLNWGSSYVVNDLYQRFLVRDKTQRHYVQVARWTTLLLMALGLAFTTVVESIKVAWEFLLQCGAGLGLVLILRWYWWRINAWSEITATLAPFLLMTIGYAQDWSTPEQYLFTVGGTTLLWLSTTFLTRPEPAEHLRSFYARVQPGGFWGPYASGNSKRKGLRLRLGAWLCSIGLLYALLFLIGKTILLEWEMVSYLAPITLVLLFALRWILTALNKEELQSE